MVHHCVEKEDGLKLPDFASGLRYRVEQKLRRDTPHNKFGNADFICKQNTGVESSSPASGQSGDPSPDSLDFDNCAAASGERRASSKI